MTARTLVLVAGLFLAGPTARIFGQTTVVTAPGAATQFTLEGLDGRDAFAPGLATPDGVGRLAGLGAAEAAPTAGFISNFGFSYVRPYWASRGQQLRVPVGNNGAVAIVSPFGDLAESFGFVPRLDLTYIGNAVEVGMSVQYIGLGGNLDRTVTLVGRSADLTASNNLSVLVLSPVTIAKAFALTDVIDHPWVEHLGRDQDTFTASIETRYVMIRQDFHASLRGGDVLASADATQTFSGIGIAAGLTSDHPLTQHLGLYTVNRASLLLGQNNRKSSATGADGIGPFSNTLAENRTTLIPTGELEIGLRYITPLDNRRPNGPIISLRGGFTGQYYGGVGFLPATSGSARFDDRALYLVGFSILAGVTY